MQTNHVVLKRGNGMHQIFEQDFYNTIFRYFERRVSSSQIAQDLTQEVYVKVLKTQLPEDIRSFKSWFFTICKNTLFDFYRKNKNHRYNDVEELYAEEAEVENEIGACLMVMINALPIEHQGLLTAIDLRGERQKEVAARLGISYSTLKSRVQRSRKKLLSTLRACCDIEKDGTGRPFRCHKK